MLFFNLRVCVSGVLAQPAGLVVTSLALLSLDIVLHACHSSI